MSPQRKLWTAFALVATILLIPPLIGVIDRYADPPEGPTLKTQLILCAHDNYGLYDADRGGRCKWGGVAVLMDSRTIETLYRKYDELTEIGICPPNVDKPEGVIVIPPQKPEIEPEATFLEDPLGGAWDGLVWILEQATGAIAWSP